MEAKYEGLGYCPAKDLLGKKFEEDNCQRATQQHLNSSAPYMIYAGKFEKGYIQEMLYSGEIGLEVSIDLEKFVQTSTGERIIFIKDVPTREEIDYVPVGTVYVSYKYTVSLRRDNNEVILKIFKENY